MVTNIWQWKKTYPVARRCQALHVLLRTARHLESVQRLT
ncbi:hypothetical protein BU14_0575s0001 [Porphyra umbilicalis]|uniref:Uncharacterized protein n=1 Tax=Porphyra umbilicalis TaxID=2786 RepID=A0A1X6NRI3_PORUM|nr:hypothetical protein BU14_0575s0001 [Porphyra umbilicalis]|eukprot:OSX71214.1 hypothetical protein BU14_0575s0001 [Porphyra umbilicalis]